MRVLSRCLFVFTAVLLLSTGLFADDIAVSKPAAWLQDAGDYVLPVLTPSEVPLGTPEESERVLIPWSERLVDTPDLIIPDTLAEWKAERPYIKALVEDTLGAIPPRPETLNSKVVFSGETETYKYEKVEIDNGYGDIIPGTIYIPKTVDGKTPAILYLHYHGKEFETGQNELLYSWPFPEGTQLIDFFIERGYIVFSIDAYAFLTRSGQGPGIDSDTGEKEIGLEEEASLYKYFTVQGMSYLGMIIRDDMIALDYLVSRPEVDSSRIGATGMSMGGTRTNWLMALDDRVDVGVSVACLTRMQDFIPTGNLVWHAMWNWVPGMLQRFDTETVVSLIAPRPYMQLMGTVDIGSPVEGVRFIEGKMHEVYDLYGKPENVEFHYYDGVGHDYLVEEFGLMLDFFDEHLKNAAPEAVDNNLTNEDILDLIADNPDEIRYYELLDSENIEGIMVIANGAISDSSPAPYISSDCIMLPLEDTAEKLGAEITLSDDGRNAEVSYLSITVEISSDSNLAINSLLGEAESMGKSVELKEGELYVPASFFADVLGINVYSKVSGEGSGFIALFN